MVQHLNQQPAEPGKKKKRWTMAEVQRMNSELRADILSSSFEADPSTWSPDVDTEIAAFLHEELSPEEQKVYSLIQKPGTTQGKTGLIAKRLGWSDSKVSRLRKAIERKAIGLRQDLS
jgi:DNA-directed RNA polymerase specialized sigma subunit